MIATERPRWSVAWNAYYETAAALSARRVLETRQKPANDASFIRGCVRRSAPPVPRVDGEDRFNGLEDRSGLEGDLALRIQPTHSVSSARLQNTMREQIVCIPSLENDTFIRLLEDAGQSMG